MNFEPLSFKEIVAQASQSPFVTAEKVIFFNRALKALEEDKPGSPHSVIIRDGITEGWANYRNGLITSSQLINQYKALLESATDIVDDKFTADHLWFLCTWKPNAGWHPWLKLLTNYANVSPHSYDVPDSFHQLNWRGEESPRKMFVELLLRIQNAYGLVPSAEKIHTYTRYTFANESRHLSVNLDNDGMGLILHNNEGNAAASPGISLHIEAEPDGTFRLSLMADYADKAVFNMGLPYRLAESRRHDEAHARTSISEVDYTLKCSWDYPRP